MMVQKDEVRQFYANLCYDARQERPKLHNNINKFQFTLTKMDLAEHALLSILQHLDQTMQEYCVNPLQLFQGRTLGHSHAWIHPKE